MVQVVSQNACGCVPEVLFAQGAEQRQGPGPSLRRHMAQESSYLRPVALALPDQGPEALGVETELLGQIAASRLAHERGHVGLAEAVLLGEAPLVPLEGLAADAHRLRQGPLGGAK